MGDSRNFVVTLNLSHFFHDHRAVCRIFISKKMKCISDLQDHILNIFNLNNFYLMSQNHYIPPTEDIRILHQGDILFAIPNVSTNTAIYTSTPKINPTTYSSVKEKRKRCIVDEEMEHSSSEIVHSNKQKKKKIKKTRTDTMEECEYQPKKLKKHKSLPRELEENSLLQADMQNDKIEKPRKKKKRKPCIVSNVPTEEYADYSVKEKVLYIENRLNLDVSKKDLEAHISNNTNIIDHQLKDQEQIEDVNNVLTEATLANEENSNEFRHKKLFVQKRNANSIDFNLPKHSNVVKSILVSSKSFNSVSTDIDTFQNKSEESNAFIIQDVVKTSITKKKDGIHKFGNIVNGHSIIDDDENMKLEKLKNDLLHTLKLSEEENRDKCIKEISTDNFQYNNEIIENTSTPEMMNIQNTDNSMEIRDTCKSSNKSNDTKNEKFINDTISKDNQNGESTPFNEENPTIEIVEISKAVPIKYNHKYNENGSNKFSEMKNTPEIDPCLKIDISSEQELSSQEVKLCSSLSTYLDNPDNQNFVTKRRRKRTRRKKKSKSVDNIVAPVVTNFECDKMMSLTAPAVHIKFNDDGDPVRISEDLKQNSQEVVQLCTNDVNQSTDISKNENEPVQVDAIFQQKNVVQNNNSFVSVNDTTDDINKRTSCSNNDLISEDTILKSPLMTSTTPKVGDLIAFKILRLTEEYTPAISKHIIGEILSVVDSTLDVNIKIIDGFDECAEPEGKFSIKGENKDCSKVKSYSWSTLISPRLIYP